MRQNHCSTTKTERTESKETRYVMLLVPGFEGRALSEWPGRVHKPTPEICQKCASALGLKKVGRWEVVHESSQAASSSQAPGLKLTWFL